MNKWCTVVSEILPDTVLHPLNGQFTVYVGRLNVQRSWLSPDDADAFAARLIECAKLARQGRESTDGCWE
jgi:hypothetical protein